MEYIFFSFLVQIEKCWDSDQVVSQLNFFHRVRIGFRVSLKSNFRVWNEYNPTRAGLSLDLPPFSLHFLFFSFYIFFSKQNIKKKKKKRKVIIIHGFKLTLPNWLHGNPRISRSSLYLDFSAFS